LEDLGNSIKSLREDTDSWSELTREVQSMVPDIKDLRVKANETIASQSLDESFQRTEGTDASSGRSYSVPAWRPNEQKYKRAHGRAQNRLQEL
jgi:hypothetical protein